LKCVQMFCLSFWGGRLNFGPLDMEPFHLHSGGVGDVFLFRGSGDRCAVASPNTGRLRRACAEPRSAKGNRGVFVCALAADGLALLSVWELPRGPALVLLRCGRRLFVFCLGRACSLVSAVFGGGACVSWWGRALSFFGPPFLAFQCVLKRSTPGVFADFWAIRHSKRIAHT
jgi:hypothetical protein